MSDELSDAYEQGAEQGADPSQVAREVVGDRAPEGEWMQALAGGQQPEQADGERQAALELAQQQADLAGLRSGEIVGEIADEREAYSEAVESLIEQHPAIRTQAAVEAMRPIHEAVREEFGDELANDPAVIGAIFERAGGSERFNDDLAEQEFFAGIKFPQEGSDGVFT